MSRFIMSIEEALNFRNEVTLSEDELREFLLNNRLLEVETDFHPAERYWPESI